jgi:phage terminase small subunit
VANEIRGKLTTKQARFVKYYVALDENATQAAIKAGYSVKNARTIAAQNLAKNYIVSEIEKIQAKARSIVDKGIATPEELLKSYTRDIRFDPISVVDPQTGALKGLHEIDREARLSLVSVQYSTKTGDLTYRFPNKNSVRDSAAKILGLTNGNHDLIEELLKNLGITVNIQNNVQINQADGSGLLKAIEAAKCGE